MGRLSFKEANRMTHVEHRSDGSVSVDAKSFLRTAFGRAFRGSLSDRHTLLCVKSRLNWSHGEEPWRVIVGLTQLAGSGWQKTLPAVDVTASVPVSVQVMPLAPGAK
jgi:hypothetical protein